MASHDPPPHVRLIRAINWSIRGSDNEVQSFFGKKIVPRPVVEIEGAEQHDCVWWRMTYHTQKVVHGEVIHVAAGNATFIWPESGSQIGCPDFFDWRRAAR